MGKIVELSDLIRRNVECLDRLMGEHGVGRILEDYVLLNAVLHMLQTSAQALLDISYRLLSLLGEKPPSSYSEAAVLLEKLGILSKEEAALLQRIAGFRDVVVDGYLALNMQLIRAILSERRYRDTLFLASKLLQAATKAAIDP